MSARMSDYLYTHPYFLLVADRHLLIVTHFTYARSIGWSRDSHCEVRAESTRAGRGRWVPCDAAGTRGLRFEHRRTTPRVVCY